LAVLWPIFQSALRGGKPIFFSYTATKITVRIFRYGLPKDILSKGPKKHWKGRGHTAPPPHMGERVKHTDKVCNITNYNFLYENTTLHLKTVNVIGRNCNTYFVVCKVFFTRRYCWVIGQAKKMDTAFSDWLSEWSKDEQVHRGAWLLEKDSLLHFTTLSCSICFSWIGVLLYSKKKWTILYSNVVYEMGHYFLDRQYLTCSLWIMNAYILC